MIQRRKVFVSALSFAFPRPAGVSRVSMVTVIIRQISSREFMSPARGEAADPPNRA
jgi:hypothetical protein